MNLGDQVRDKVSGLVGTVTAITDYLGGRRMCEVAPSVGPDNKFIDSVWLDPKRLESVPAGAGDDQV